MKKILNIKKIKAFTMLEILMITLIIGIWLLSIIIAITKAKTVTNQTKQSVIATQLAKEWIEMVYQIRNTNLLKHTNFKNYCWLNQNPKESCNSFNNPNRIIKSGYILTWQLLKPSANILDLSNWISNEDQTFSLCLQSWQRISCQWSENQTDFGKFFRVIEWKWLYIKDVNLTWWDEISCLNWSTEWTSTWWNYFTCWAPNDLHPMEFHFCSRVEYLSTKADSVEICGILTNFFD